jgi:hypothetical protein
MIVGPADTQVKGGARRGGWRKPLGVLLAAIGLFWLSKKAGWMPIEHGHSAIFWPILFIAVGLFIFFNSRHRHSA